jgi:TolA-binding protein
MPLPQIFVQGALPVLGAHAEIPSPRELSPEAAKALEELPVRPAPDVTLRSPRVFARDLTVPQAGGEDSALFSIVNGAFAARNWEAARNELVRFLSLPRSPDVQARARFYLGQCYYFLRQPREGLFEFLAIQDRHPTEAMVWIQASLDMLKEQ